MENLHKQYLVKISILIPVYNAEFTLQRCLNSLIGQSSQEFEVVIINDGSTDHSEDIVLQYENVFKHYKHLFQSNAGVSATRQRLLDISSGEYFMFCDADDYLESDAIEHVMKILEDNTSDLVVFGYNLVREHISKTIHRRSLSNGLHNKSEWSQKHIKGMSDLYWSVLWNKCYKKDIYKQPNKIKFQTLIEDVTFNAEYFGRCNIIYVTDAVLYNYIQIGDSITRTKLNDSDSNIIASWNAFERLNNAFMNSYPDQKIEIFEEILIALWMILNRAKRNNNLSLYKVLKSNEFYLELKGQLKRKRIKLLSKIFLLKIKSGIRKIIIN